MRKIFTFIMAIALMTACSVEKKPMNLTVASFNIRCDVARDSLNAWPNRKDLAADFIKRSQLDIFGTQEVLYHQLTDLLSRLPEYGYVGVGREDGKEKGEFMAIFYNKSRLKVVSQNTFWLSEDTTAVGKKGWDAACERVVTWALMEEIATGSQFYFVNTHFDHMGPIARINSAKLLIDRVQSMEKQHPVITTGDFNAEMSSNVYEALTKTVGTPLIDSRSIAQKIEGPAWSFHGWNQVPEGSREIIDYVFVTKGTTVNDYKLVFEDHNGLYITDHCPLVVSLQIQP